jgi:hypothetical protein
VEPDDLLQAAAAAFTESVSAWPDDAINTLSCAGGSAAPEFAGADELAEPAAELAAEPAAELAAEVLKPAALEVGAALEPDDPADAELVLLDDAPLVLLHAAVTSRTASPAAASPIRPVGLDFILSPSAG